MTKTDRKDASEYAAQLLRMGWYRPVHAKSVTCKIAEPFLLDPSFCEGKLLDVELSIRGILRGYGLKGRRSQSWKV